MLYVNCIICSMEILDFDNLSNLKYKTTKNIRKKSHYSIISYRYTLLFVSIARVSTNFANAENIQCFLQTSCGVFGLDGVKFLQLSWLGAMF